jgi:hypothetical protein
VGEFRGVTRNGFVQFTASCEGVDLFWGLLKAKHAISLRRVYGDFRKENNWKVLGNCDQIEIDVVWMQEDPSLRFLAEAQPRLKNGEVHIKFFRRTHELQSKRHHYLFQIDKFINACMYLLSACQQN